MDFTLMHKNIPVLDFLLDEHSGRIIKRGDIHNSKHLPIGTTVAVGVDAGKVALNKLNEWWFSRSIPSSRDGLRTALETLNLKSAAQLILKSNAFSLSDQYWVRPKNSDISWESLNFFDNDFSSDTGEILFGRAFGDIAKANLRSPDNTSSGWLKKKWIISDNKRVLMKGGSGVFRQEPFNEVIATNIMRRLSINHIPYTLLFKDDQTYSLCDDFISKNTELIPAWSVKECFPKGNSESELQHLLRCADSLGIPNIRTDIDKMLTLDFIINNEDRHFGNFGFIRNADSLEWLGMSPIFDCGTSLWYNDLNVGSTDKSNPFKPTHAQQIKLVSNFSWLDFSALSGLNTDICSIFLPSDRIDEARAEAIANAVIARCEELKSNKHFTGGRKITSKNGIVLAIIKGKSTGIRVFYPDSKATEDIIPMPDKADYLNASISNKTLNPIFCSIENFPTLVASPDGYIVWQSGGAWILDELPGGRFTLVSPTGTVKTVSAEVALSYHKQHPLANGFVESGVLKHNLTTN